MNYWPYGLPYKSRTLFACTITMDAYNAYNYNAPSVVKGR